MLLQNGLRHHLLNLDDGKLVLSNEIATNRVYVNRGDGLGTLTPHEPMQLVKTSVWLMKQWQVDAFISYRLNEL